MEMTQLKGTKSTASSKPTTNRDSLSLSLSLFYLYEVILAMTTIIRDCF
jgi:hypothetical protein